MHIRGVIFANDDRVGISFFRCVCACVVESAKGGVVMLVPSFLCTMGLFKDAWHRFFRIWDAFESHCW